MLGCGIPFYVEIQINVSISAGVMALDTFNSRCHKEKLAKFCNIVIGIAAIAISLSHIAYYS